MKNILKNWLTGNSKSANRDGFIWNAIAAGLNAGQAAIVLFFVNYKFGIEMAGIVTIGYAIANLFQTIGRYGMRNYQVTDLKEKFSFSDYFYSRIATVSLTLLAAIVYLIVCHISGYSLEKTFIILEIVALKLAEAFLEVYVCRCQQRGRLDIGSKIYASELVLSTAVMCILLLLGVDMYGAVLAGIVTAIAIGSINIKFTMEAAESSVGKFDRKKVIQLLKIGIVLCIGQTLYMYVGNAPKYLIDFYMDEKSQAIFGFIMMPMFVVTLLNSFLVQPIVRKLGEMWDGKHFEKLKKMVLRQYMIVAALSGLVLLLGIFVGLPLLSVLYSVNLNAYRFEFCILMAAGMFQTIAYYLTVVLTAIRNQNFIVFGYAAAVLIYLLLGGSFIAAYGMRGAAYLYLLANALTAVLFTVFAFVGMRKKV